MKVYLKLIFILIFCSLQIKGVTQYVQLSLKHSTNDLVRYIHNQELVQTFTDTQNIYKFNKTFKGKYVIKKYTLDYANSVYWRYKKGQITKEYFEKLVSLYKINESSFYTLRELNCEVKILMLLNEENVFSYYFDTNNDNDFTNEKQYFNQDLSNVPFVKIFNIETYINNKITIGTLLVNRYENYCDTVNLNDVEKKWQLCLKIKPFKWASLKFNYKTIKIICTSDTDYGLEFNKNKTRFYFIQDDSDFRSIRALRFYDTFFLKEKMVIIDSIDKRGNFLRLKFLNNKSKIEYGFNETNTVKNTLLKFIDSTKINLYNITGKYILLDFWGTWCVPCEKMYPMLDSLKQKISNTSFKDSVIYISIAKETMYSLEKYNSVIKEKYIGWKNILITENIEGSLIEKLNIQAYPTVILLSPSKKILNRINGINEFDKFKKQFVSLFLMEKSVH